MGLGVHWLRRERAEVGWRSLVGAVLVDSFGTGLFTTASVVFFTRHIGMTGQQVGVGMSIAGVIALGSGTLVGSLADRFAARNVRIALDVWRGGAVLGFLLVDGVVGYVIVLAALLTAERANSGTLQILVGSVVAGAGRVRATALVRVTFNVGMTMGALAASLALLRVTNATFVLVIVINSVSFAVAALLVARVPVHSRRAKDPGSGLGWRTVARDRPYLVLTAANGVLALHQTLIILALPLWVATHPNLPASLTGAVIAISAVIAITLQIPFSARANDVPGAALLLARAGVALAVGCFCMVLASASDHAAVQGGMLIVAVVFVTFAELWQSAGAWGAGYELAPEEARARYLAVFGLGPSVEQLVAPALLTALVFPAGSTGWMAVALVAVTAGFVARRSAMYAGGAIRHPDQIPASDVTSAALSQGKR